MSNLEFTKDELVMMAIGHMAGAASVQTSTEMSYCKRLASQALFYLKQNEALKKDLLNLLPIARENTQCSLVCYEKECRALSDLPDADITYQYRVELIWIDELTAKYADNHITDVGKKVARPTHDPRQMRFKS